MLDEGPYGQAHRVYGEGNAAPMAHRPMKGGDQAYLAVCGGTVASAVIRTMFGWAPPVPCDGATTGVKKLLDRPDVPRGFNGTLRGVRFAGKWYNIESRAAEGLFLTEAP